MIMMKKIMYVCGNCLFDKYTNIHSHQSTSMTMYDTLKKFAIRPSLSIFNSHHILGSCGIDFHFLFIALVNNLGVNFLSWINCYISQHYLNRFLLLHSVYEIKRLIVRKIVAMFWINWLTYLLFVLLKKISHFLLIN